MNICKKILAPKDTNIPKYTEIHACIRAACTRCPARAPALPCPRAHRSSFEAQVRVLSKIEKTFINLFEKILQNVTLLERARVRLHEEEWKEKGEALERAKLIVPKMGAQITALKQMLESQKAMTRQWQVSLGGFGGWVSGAGEANTNHHHHQQQQRRRRR